MTPQKNRDKKQALAVPSGRVNRFARLGTMTAGIAGNMALGAAQTLGRGERPKMRDLLITPSNMRRLTNQLAQMRGAAMKVGQLISMDAGDVLPPELADMLARLRDQAHFMPPQQLRNVLNHNWGPDWRREFAQFNVRPLAAASIGQVHHGRLKDGREVAIKVQYPGIARSIDSDVANVAALVRLAGLVPKGFDMAPYLAEARRQLHEETDYTREGRYLRQFSNLLSDTPGFLVPDFHEDWSTQEVLTMSYHRATAIEDTNALSQDQRDTIMAALVALTLREVFDFQLTQSDPNFANYRYCAEDAQNAGRILLLDFGATRPLEPRLIPIYRCFLRAGLDRDAQGLRQAAQDLGVLSGTSDLDHDILAMIDMCFAAIVAEDRFDFARTDLIQRLREKGMELAASGYVPPPMPMDVLYLQRKLGGMFLLAARLRSVLPLGAMLRDHLDGSDPKDTPPH